MQAAPTNPDILLAQDMATFFADPLGFVMYAYPWDTDPSLQLVELQEPWASRYGCKHGPDAWACQFLDDVGYEVEMNGFDGKSPVRPIRGNVKSGHGIGKSAITAWLVNWIMSTRPYAQGTVTASTGPQLETKTWAQIAKWTRKCITSHWFEVSTGRGSMKMVHKDHPESWFCSAQTCREENSEAFAGQHAANSTSFYIFDESSAVPDKIDEVSEGGLSDGEPMKFKFGNPTRNNGHFHAEFNKHRGRGSVNMSIDSRDVQITNKALFQEWIDTWGLDSDFVRVRVLGKFPKAASTQLIGVDIIREAQGRDVPDQAHHPVIIGVDVARFGDDRSVIRIRRGRDASSFPKYVYRNLDTMQLAARVIEAAEPYKQQTVAIFVDGGGVGGGVVDRLRQLGHNVVEVVFAGKSSDPRYANKRAEMYARMKDWLQAEGSIDDDPELETDLVNIEYRFDNQGRLLLERKEDMKKRGLDSPDDGDALAMTFAESLGMLPQRHDKGHSMQHEYDPYAFEDE